jgi:hypothetical protein
VGLTDRLCTLNGTAHAGIQLALRAVGEVEREVEEAGRHPLAGLAGRLGIRDLWPGLDLGRRRAVLRALADVTLLAAARGGRLMTPVPSEPTDAPGCAIIMAIFFLLRAGPTWR